jgi:hypothetical protein
MEGPHEHRGWIERTSVEIDFQGMAGRSKIQDVIFPSECGLSGDICQGEVEKGSQASIVKLLAKQRLRA